MTISDHLNHSQPKINDNILSKMDITRFWIKLRKIRKTKFLTYMSPWVEIQKWQKMQILSFISNIPKNLFIPYFDTPDFEKTIFGTSKCLKTRYFERNMLMSGFCGFWKKTIFGILRGLYLCQTLTRSSHIDGGSWFS